MSKQGYYYYQNLRAGAIFLSCLGIIVLFLGAKWTSQVSLQDITSTIHSYRLYVLLGLVVSFLIIYAYRSRRPAQKFASTPGARRSTLPFIKLDPIAFEKLVANIFRLEGYHVTELGGRRADGGIDLIIERPGMLPIGVQCKKYYHEDIKVNEIREFIGALKVGGYSKGIFITIKGFTVPAQDIAALNDIELWEHSHLQAVLQRHAEAGTLDKETEQLSNSVRQYCSNCHSAMDLMRARKGRFKGLLHWRCSERRCNKILPFADERGILDDAVPLRDHLGKIFNE